MQALVSKNHPYFKTIMSFFLAMITALSPLAIDAYLAAMPKIATFFASPIDLVKLSLPAYLFGFAFGQFFGGPFSDTFGRKKIVLIGITVYVLTSIAITSTSSIHLFIGLRVVQAIGGGFVSVTNMGFIRDWFKGKDVAKVTSIVSVITMLAPLVAPSIGTELLYAYNWHAIFYFLAIVGVLFFVLFLLFVPESRTKEQMAEPFKAKGLYKAYLDIYLERRPLFLILSASFIISGLFVFLTNASDVYIKHFNFTEERFTHFFLGNVSLNILFSFINISLLKHYSTKHISLVGVVLAFASTTVLVISSFLAPSNFWLFFVPTMLFIGLLPLIFPNISSMIINMFPKTGGSTNAVIGVSRFVLSAFIASIPSFLTSLSSLLSSSLVMGLCSAVALVCFLLYYRTPEPTKRPA